MNTRKVIAAGHICIDITPIFTSSQKYNHLDELLVPGKLIHMGEADVHTGGSVANTGLALKFLGNDVTLMGKIGDDDFGKMVEQILARYGASGLLTDKNSSTSYSVVIAVPGIDRIFLHNPGANDTFTGADIPEEALDEVVLFHFGYPPLMRKMYQQDGKELASIFRRMKEKNIATSLDFAAIDPNSEAGQADWMKILENVLPYVDFFVPSFEELLFMLNPERYNELVAEGGDMTDGLDVEEDVAPLADKLLELGCKAVLIKCGITGMYFKSGPMDGVGERLELNQKIWQAKTYFQPCFKADIVRSATGAGDTSIAAFLTAVLRGKAPEKAVALASAEGACAVTSYDALGGLKQLEELEARIEAGW